MSNAACTMSVHMDEVRSYVVHAAHCFMQHTVSCSTVFCVYSAVRTSVGQSVEHSFALLVRTLEDLKLRGEKVARIKILRETLVQQQSATLDWLKSNGVR